MQSLATAQQAGANARPQLGCFPRPGGWDPAPASSLVARGPQLWPGAVTYSVNQAPAPRGAWQGLTLARPGTLVCSVVSGVSRTPSLKMPTADGGLHSSRSIQSTLASLQQAQHPVFSSPHLHSWEPGHLWLHFQCRLPVPSQLSTPGLARVHPR